MKKIKNVIIINDFDYIQGGASKVAIDTANSLVEKYNEINIYFFSGKSDSSTVLNNKIIKVSTNQDEALKEKNKIKGFFNGLYNIRAERELKKLLKKLNKEETIIHVHGWTKVLSSSIFRVIFKSKFKTVLTAHDYFSACPNGGYYNYKKDCICNLKPLSLRCSLCNCDSRNYIFKMYRLIRQFIQNKIVRINYELNDIITISQFSEEILKKSFRKDINIHRVYNPINNCNEKKIVDYKKNDYFLYVGRVDKEKGVDIFCEALTKTNKKGVVVGDGKELQFLKNKYNNIEFVGWKNQSEVKKYMLKAQCLIFPSKLYETMGMTVIEAQNIGLPVIVNNKTAAAEFVINDSFKYNNLDELIKIIKNFESYDFKFYSYDYDYVNSVFDVYNKILERR